MTTRLLLSSGLVLALFGLWVLVQVAARAFARRHPAFGPAREEGGECGVSCGCANWKSCATFRKGDCNARKQSRGLSSDANPSSSTPPIS